MTMVQFDPLLAICVYGGSKRAISGIRLNQILKMECLCLRKANVEYSAMTPFNCPACLSTPVAEDGKIIYRKPSYEEKLQRCKHIKDCVYSDD